jgi:BA14K-like protein
LPKQKPPQAVASAEKQQSKENKLMRHNLVLAVSAVAVGAALAAVPAFAQDSSQGSAQQSQYPIGRPMNDGGYQAQSQNSNSAQRTDARENRGASTAPSSTAQRNMTYRGVHRTGTAENRARRTGNPSSMAAAQSNNPPTGRAMNDGGFPAEQAQNAGPTNYAFDPNSGYGGGYGGGFGGYGGGPFYNYAGGPTLAGGPVEPGAIEACQARFQSYDPNTGTYLGFDGIRHPCP